MLAAIVLWVLYKRTRFGFEAQVLGDSPRAARYAGVRMRRKILAVMGISGAIAGLGGVEPGSATSATRSTATRTASRSIGYGYTGIVVAALGRYNPFAVVVIAFLLGRARERRQHAAGPELPRRASSA